MLRCPGPLLASRCVPVVEVRLREWSETRGGPGDGNWLKAHWQCRDSIDICPTIPNYPIHYFVVCSHNNVPLVLYSVCFNAQKSADSFLGLCSLSNCMISLGQSENRSVWYHYIESLRSVQLHAKCAEIYRFDFSTLQLLGFVASWVWAQ